MKKLTLTIKLRLFVALQCLLLVSIAVLGVARNGIIMRDNNNAQVQLIVAAPDAG